MRIDAHQHFWQYNPVRDAWITPEMAVIQKDFMPEDLAPLLQQHHLDGCVAVQADQSVEETNFLASLAAQHSFIKGIVGWVDLQADNCQDQLEAYEKNPVIKGFRHVLQGEKQRDLMLQENFRRGITLLSEFGFTYDILIYPDQLPFTETFVSLFPDQPMVIDHLAKPAIAKAEIKDWKSSMQRLAAYPNVYCKVSGMITEADWQHWKPADFTPYLDVVTEAFGTNRILFGSDWPVCLVAGSYSRMMAAVADYYSTFSQEEQAAIFGGNAVLFYNL